MSNYTQLGFVKQTDGENTGTWGDVLNANLIDLLDDAIGGYVEVSVASGNVTLAFADGTADNNGRHAVIKFTGSPGTTRTVTFPDAQVNYFIINGSDGSVICTSGSGAATVTIPTGMKDIIYVDGSDEILSMLGTPNLSSSGNFTVDATTDIILDADGGDIFFKDGGTTFGSATNTSGNLIVKSGTTTAATFSGANVTLAGTVGSGAITSTGAIQGTTITATSAFAGTLSTAAQTNITSLGTLTALTVDDVAINGKVVTMTGSASDTAVFTAGTNGTLDITTTDAAAAAANIQITADGTVDIDSAGVLTLDSGAAINIEPASGSAILLDGTISVDAGVVTGATSITSTAFVGTLSTAAQANVTSLGTLTALTVDNVSINGTTIGHTSDNDLMTLGSAILTVAGEVQMTTLDIGGTNVTTTAAEINLIDGGTSRGTTAVASGDGILINDDGTMRMTNVDTVSTYFASHNVGGGNIVTTGALDSGSITSGFGAIDNGTSGIRTNTFTAETSLVPDASGGADIGTTSLEWGDFYIADDKYIQFGSDQNVLVGYDETTTDSLKIAATEGAGLAITLMADEGDDAGDEWKLNVADGGTITLGNDINSAGTYVTHFTLAPNSTVTSSLATFAGEVQMVTLDIGGTNVTATAAELNYSDLATLGTSAASKVLSADSNNLTKITGGVYLEEDTLSFDATQDWDVRASPVAQVTLTANVTFDLPSNPTTGQYISILCIQDGTGSRTIAWNAAFEFTGGTAPTATTTAGKADLFTFRYHNSHWVEVGRNLNLTRA